MSTQASKTCADCNKTFSTNQQLSRHLNRSNRCNSKICPHCKVSFTRKHNLDYHVEHRVCLRDSSDMIEHLSQRKYADENDLSFDQTRLKIAQIELEQAKILLKIEELKSKNAAQPTQTHTINNAEKVVINYITIGNENLDPLNREVLQTMSVKPKESFTDIGIQWLYFNRQFPENQILQTTNPTSKNVRLYNGITWLPTPRQEAAQKMLSGLVEAVKRKFRELPRNDKELDRMFDKICYYIYDQIEDSSVNPTLVDEVAKNFYTHYTKLKTCDKV